MLYVNAVPTIPLAVAALVITGVAGLMVIVTVFDPVPPALIALTVEVYVPAVVGVPVIAPVEVFTESPAGRPLAA